MTPVLPYCEFTYAFAHIPIYIYQGEDLLTHFGGHLVPESIRTQLLKDPASTYILETNIHTFYGRITLTEYTLIMGPVTPGSYTQDMLHHFLTAYPVPQTVRDTFIQHLRQIPRYSNEAFIAFMRQMTIALTGEEIDAGYWDIVRSRAQIQAEEFPLHFMDTQEEAYENNLYSYEALTTHFFVNGDIDGMIKFAKSAPPMYWGRYSDDLKENQKVIFIISLYSITRAAIQGGLDPQTALSLLEYHISRGIKLTSAAEIDRYSNAADMDLLQRVKEAQSLKTAHRTVQECIDYIRSHVYMKLTVADVAAYAGYSPEHLSRLFKKEAGFGISEFIMSCKLYEAQILLRSTNMSIGEISYQLQFSDQSHLQRQFKKKFGMTPSQYRDLQGDAAVPSIQKALQGGR